MTDLYSIVLMKCRNVMYAGEPVHEVCGIGRRDCGNRRCFTEACFILRQFSCFVEKIIFFKNIFLDKCKMLVILMLDIVSAHDHLPSCKGRIAEEIGGMQSFHQ